MTRAGSIGAWATLVGAAVAVLVIASGAGPADAAFPGSNGRIAFSGNPNVLQQSNSSIYTVRPDGRGQTRLTRASGTKSDESPSFSPNGRKIVFDRYNLSSGCSQIFVMDADGSDRTRLTDRPRDGGCNFQPTWGREGRIAFTSTRDGNAEVYVMDADGSDQTNLSNNPGVDQAPSYSPDGGEIAFESRRESNQDIYVMGSDGSNQERLTTAGGEQPAFSPDGSRIAFVYNNQIFRIDPSDGSKKRRVSSGGDLSTARTPDWGVMPGS